MSLARSFTKRLARAESITSPTRATSTRKLKPGDISLPVGLLSTTNMLSYDAPSLVEAQKLMALQTTNLPSERNRSASASSDEAPTSTPSLTDGSSVENSPVVEHNHLSCYFPGPTAPPKRSQSTHATPPSATEVAPTLPKRALSHSKREHERLARKRSVRSSNPASPTIPSSPRTSNDVSARPSLESTDNGTSDLHTSIKHALGPELQRLPEVAEEPVTVVATDMDLNGDAAYMRQRGLCKFTANDYLSEIGRLVFSDTDSIACF